MGRTDLWAITENKASFCASFGALLLGAEMFRSCVFSKKVSYGGNGPRFSIWEPLEFII